MSGWVRRRTVAANRSAPHPVNGESGTCAAGFYAAAIPIGQDTPVPPNPQ